MSECANKHPMQVRAEKLSHWKAKKGLRAAVNAKCIECIYDPGNGGGTWREQVQDCTDGGCPLYPYRPRVLKKGRTNSQGDEISENQYQGTGSGY